MPQVFALEDARKADLPQVFAFVDARKVGMPAPLSDASPVVSRRHIADASPAAIEALPHSEAPHVGVKLPPTA